ncbi:hypothetical protein L7F22_065385 [Adiantum nelumboides]|nr:hypothetical protein [Adiantum nelumboides]
MSYFFGLKKRWNADEAEEGVAEEEEDVEPLLLPSLRGEEDKLRPLINESFALTQGKGEETWLARCTAMSFFTWPLLGKGLPLPFFEEL